MDKIQDKKLGKIIRRRRTQVEFLCNICRTGYATLKQAQKCAAMPTEPKKFALGDRVTWRELARCSKKKGSFRIEAVVARVLSPNPPDEEYNSKWLGGALNGMHARQYEVHFRCICGGAREMLLYATEMKKL